MDVYFNIFFKPGVGSKGENGATPLHLAARFQVDRPIESVEGTSRTGTPEDTPKCSKKQVEAQLTCEKLSTTNASQKSYLKPPSFGLRKRDSGGTPWF